MFDWLFEGQLTVYLLLGVAAAGLLGLWWRDRSKAWLIAAGGVAALAGVYVLLDRAVETRREQITRKLREMAAAIEKNDPDKLLGHVSARFEWEGVKKDAFAKVVRAALPLAKGKGVTVKEPHFPDDKGKVAFAITAWDARGNTYPAHVKAEFVREADGEWRLRALEIRPVAGDRTIRLADLQSWAGY